MPRKPFFFSFVLLERKARALRAELHSYDSKASEYRRSTVIGQSYASTWCREAPPHSSANQWYSKDYTARKTKPHLVVKRLGVGVTPLREVRQHPDVDG